MQRKALDVLACPNCLSRLVAPNGGQPEIDEGTLTCPQEDIDFAINSGVPLLVRSNSKARVLAFEESFSQAWSKDGWGAQAGDYLFNLPERDVTGRHPEEWRVKFRSMQALFRILDKTHPAKVVDLGCGIGWLAHRLASRNYEVFAVDIVRDFEIGLGAAGRYVRRGPYFERVWGELERPPFRDNCVDAVICNASLHYTTDLEISLREIARILRPGGLFAMLNSPVHRDARSALRAQDGFRRRLIRLGANNEVVSVYQHLTKSRIENGVRHHIGPVEEAPFDPGKAFLLVRRAKQLVLQMELASFPIIWARKT